MKIVVKKIRRDGSHFFQIASWFSIDRRFYVFDNSEYPTRIAAVLAERKRYMNQVVKTERVR